MTKSVRRGRLIDYGITLESHEMATVEFLLSCGCDVELLLPSNTINNYSPDMMMWGVIWEMKSPVVETSASLARLFRHAAKQSCNIIFDLRRIKKKDEKDAIRFLKRLLKTSRHARRLIIITHDAGMLDLTKKMLDASK